MKQNGTPVQKPLRRVPIAMKDKSKQELDSLEAQGIISKYDGHDVSPEWLNSFVIVKKLNGASHRQWMMLSISYNMPSILPYSIPAKGFFTFL